MSAPIHMLTSVCFPFINVFYQSNLYRASAGEAWRVQGKYLFPPLQFLSVFYVYDDLF